MLERTHELGVELGALLVNGSFVTGRDQPADVDVACLIPPNKLRRILSQSPDGDALLFFIKRPHDARRITGVHFFIAPNGTFFDKLSEAFRLGTGGKGLRPPDPDRDPAGLTVPKEKGILRVDLSDFKPGEANVSN